MFVTKEFVFDSAHYLENYHGKCEKMHGHTYKMHVTIQGEVKDDGLLYDFVALKKVVKENVVNILDHTLLNDVIKNPSAENIVIWAWNRLDEKIDGANLYEIKLWETPTSFVTYRGNEGD